MFSSTRNIRNRTNSTRLTHTDRSSGGPWEKLASDCHENRVVQPKLDRTKHKTPSLRSWGLAELARLYGGTWSKSLRFVSAQNAFFGNTLCLTNFRESVNGGGWPPKQYKNSTETLGNINIFKFSIMRGTRPSVSEGFGMGSALP